MYTSERRNNRSSENWDTRFSVVKNIPAYNALKDKHCKFTKTPKFKSFYTGKNGGERRSQSAPKLIERANSRSTTSNSDRIDNESQGLLNKMHFLTTWKVDTQRLHEKLRSYEERMKSMEQQLHRHRNDNTRICELTGHYKRMTTEIESKDKELQRQREVVQQLTENMKNCTTELRKKFVFTFILEVRKLHFLMQRDYNQ